MPDDTHPTDLPRAPLWPRRLLFARDLPRRERLAVLGLVCDELAAVAALWEHDLYAVLRWRQKTARN